jgi:hypothetical protein
MKHRCGQFFLCLLFFFCVCVSISSAQEQSTEAGFVKLDSQGQELSADAEQWAMVRDKATGLVWEVKTTDGSIHDRDKTFGWGDAEQTFIAELNSSKFGGFSNWRLPTTDELRTIRVKGAEPYINQDFFPNTISTGYLSWRKCGSGDIYDERVKFGKIRNTKKDRRVRAVRSGQE